jgi:hypothetical protein
MLKETARGAGPVAGLGFTRKCPTGATFGGPGGGPATLMVCEHVAEPDAPVALTTRLYPPGTAYTWGAFGLLPDVPSPYWMKRAAPGVTLTERVTRRGAIPDVGLAPHVSETGPDAEGVVALSSPQPPYRRHEPRTSMTAACP